MNFRNVDRSRVPQGKSYGNFYPRNGSLPDKRSVWCVFLLDFAALLAALHLIHVFQL